MYSIQKAKKILSQLIEEAASGNDVVIARGGVPAARLIAINVPQRRRPGSLKGRLKAKPGAFEPLSKEELHLFGIK